MRLKLAINFFETKAHGELEIRRSEFKKAKSKSTFSLKRDLNFSMRKSGYDIPVQVKKYLKKYTHGHTIKRYRN